MPWALEDYPVSMRHLAEVTRAKAIDIANALLAEGMWSSAVVLAYQSQGVAPIRFQLTADNRAPPR